MERFVPKVKKYVSRLKNDKSTPSVPADPPVDPPVIAQQSARQDSPAPLDTISPPQRIWNQAYDELKKPENEQAIVEAYEKILSTYLSPTTAMTQDNNGPQNLINADPAKRWKQMEQLVQKGLEKTAKDADIKEKVNHWITIIQPLRDAISTGVKAAPAAAIPWAGICCALQIVSSPLTEPKKNRDGMTYVLSRMQWYWELWRLVLDENLSSSSARPLQTELEKQVKKLYRKLLLYQMKSVITYHRSRFTVFLRDLPKLDDWATLVSEVKDAENAVMRDVEQYSTLDMRTKLRGILSSADEQAKYLANMFNQNETHYAWVREERHKEKDDNCLRDLHKTDPRYDKRSIISAKGGLVYDSYRWVTENQQYKQWYEDRSNHLLWIKGDPGKGKTMLLCGIIDELEKSKPNAVFYFFCQASDPSLRSATYVLRGLIWSLARTRPSLISHIRQQYDQAGADIFVNRNAWQALSEIFTAILSDDAAADCVFVVDALDECTDGQEQLIDLISRLSNACEARWIISSRNWQTIEGQLDSVTADARLQLELNAVAIAEAVHYFINHKVKELARGKRLNDDIRAKLNEYLVTNADDTFLWVALVCEELSKLNVAARHVLQVARSFPSGLTKLYERIMAIMKQSPDKKFCEAVLALSAVAIRPLTLPEIATLDIRLKEVSEDLEAVADVVRSCGSFLTIREDSVHIVHQSARDYLIQASEIFPLGIAGQHYQIFAGSMNTMHRKLHRNMYQLESTILIDEITPPNNQPLNGIQYACIYWLNHFDAWYCTESHSPDVGDSAYSLLITFFTTKCLYWFEAMSLLHHVSDVIRALRKLRQLIQSGPQELKSLIGDAFRWTLNYRSIMDSAPMQLYDSALLFSPQRCKIRQHFDTEAPVSIKALCPSFQEWDACLLTISGVSAHLSPLVISPDRTKLAVIKQDNVTVLVLDAVTGGYLQSIRIDGGGEVFSLSYHPDGRHLISLSRDQNIRIWDIDNQECLQCFNPTEAVETGEYYPGVYSDYGLPISTDGRFMALYSPYHNIELWDLRSRVCTRTLYDVGLHKDVQINWFDWGLDRSNMPLLLVAKFVKELPSVQIDAWNPETGQQLLKGARAGRYFKGAAVRPDRRQLAVSTNEGISIVQWDVDVTIQKVINQSTVNNVREITWSDDGKLLAMIAEPCIVLFNLEKQEESFLPFRYSDSISSLCYGKNNMLAALDYDDQTLKIWSVEFSSDLPVSVKEMVSMVALEIGPNENLAVFEDNGDIEFLNVLTGKARQIIHCPAFHIANTQFVPEHHFAVLLAVGIIQIWDLASGHCTKRLDMDDDDFDRRDAFDWPRAMALGTAGRIVTIGRQLKIWNLVTGTSLDIPHTLKPAHSRFIACSSNGRLAYNYNPFEVAVWGSDWTGEKQLLRVANGKHDICGLSINSAGLLIVNGRNDVSVWNCEDGTMIRKYNIPEIGRHWVWDSRYQSGLNTRFGIIDLEVEEADSRTTEPKAEGLMDSARIRMSTVAMEHSGHLMILRISAEHS
ncbi:hypothetical protein KAF25_001639 [Fusarium avenaceum]|uniref:NACHT domain-containing protein n=1 Tax=Fusarium avenaceum TaxID=40199 RepID=A0A9P7KNC8_9HYPO|nr:hypothetical protein KAF25_001639 [Fusarium avenaceum]